MSEFKIENLVSEKLLTAAAALVRIDQSPNQELRGRPAVRTIERIEEFTTSNDFYKTLLIESFRLPGGADNFEAKARSTLLKIDKIIASNPELNTQEFREQNRVTLYEAAIHRLFVETQTPGTRQTARMPNPNHTPKLDSTSATEESVLENQENKINDKNDFEILEKQEALEQEILDLTEAFISGRIESFSGQVDFAEKLKQAQSSTGPSSNNIELALSLMKDFGFGPDCLEDILSVKKLCEKVNNSPDIGYAEASKLIFGIDSLRSTGISAISLKSLKREAVLTDFAHDLLQKLSSIKDPITHKIAYGLSHEAHLSAAKAVELNEAVESLKTAGFKDSWIEKRFLTVLKNNPDKISYLTNLAKLAVRGADIDKLLDKKGDVQTLIKRLADGEFDIVPPTDSRYRNILQGAIDELISISKQDNVAIKNSLFDCLTYLTEKRDYQTFGILKLLSEYAQTAPAENIEQNLKILAKSISTITRGGAPMNTIRGTLLLAPQPEQLEENGHPKVLEFFQKLELLQDQGVRGISELLYDGLVVLNRRQSGDLSQHFSGFLLEAKTAVDLQNLGYKIISMSQPLKAIYKYDIVARSPEGQLMGIEVKRSIETFFNKNNTGYGKIDKVAENQLYRHVQSAKMDQIVPVIAIKIGPNQSWAVNLAKEIIDQVESKLGARPVFIDRHTGRLIPNL